MVPGKKTKKNPKPEAKKKQKLFYTLNPNTTIIGWYKPSPNGKFIVLGAGWCPPVISWFINPINYSYIFHKP